MDVADDQHLTNDLYDTFVLDSNHCLTETPTTTPLSAIIMHWSLPSSLSR